MDPSTPLPVVEAWRTAGAARAGIILADGCMDLVTDGEIVLVAGPDARARRFTPRAASPMWGLRFHPGVLPGLLGCPADRLLDQVVPLAEVTGVRLTPTDLRESTVVLRRFGDRRPDDAPLGITALLRSGASVDEVAGRAGWSVRQLRRLSASWFGYGPKHLQRVLRVQRAEALLACGASLTLAAGACGYADASHLWRDRRDLVSVADTDQSGQ